jgi:hypothetical protein
MIAFLNPIIKAEMDRHNSEEGKGKLLIIVLSCQLALIKLFGILLNFFRFDFLFSKLISWKETQLNIMIQLKIILTGSQFINTILTKISWKTLKRLLQALK